MPFVDLSSITNNSNPGQPVPQPVASPASQAITTSDSSNSQPIGQAASQPVSTGVTPVVSPADNSAAASSVGQPMVTSSLTQPVSIPVGQPALESITETTALPTSDTVSTPTPADKAPVAAMATSTNIVVDPMSVTPSMPVMPYMSANLDGQQPMDLASLPQQVDPALVRQLPPVDFIQSLPELPQEIKPGSMAPVPEPAAEPEQVELNEFSPGELNSLNIEPIDPQVQAYSSLTSIGKNKVGLEIDENGVKTITGPQLATSAGQGQIAANSLGTGAISAGGNSTGTAAMAGSTTSAKVVVNPGQQLNSSATIEEIMALAEQKKASDIHFAANYPIMLRVDGRLAPFSARLTGEQTAQLAKQLLNQERQQKFAEAKELDFSFTNANQTRFRVNLFTERDNVAGALRLIEKNIRTMKELDLPDVLFEIVDEPHGLVLVVGPTGSGKSTTLAAMLNHINLNRADHILTIEDPIEYVYPQEMSIVNQREVGADTHAWQAALKSALREDPDVVLVGEMRDLDTIESTITIAETGHLTFATLHTNSAAQAIDRIIDVFPEGSKEQIRAQLANVITAVVSQRLIPVQTGGRRAALEVMLGTVAVRNAIREGKTYQIDNIIQTSGDLGMITLEKSLVNLVKKGYISKDVAKAHSAKPDEIDSLISNLRL